MAEREFRLRIWRPNQLAGGATDAGIVVALALRRGVVMGPQPEATPARQSIAPDFAQPVASAAPELV
jgi:hypothetical protein